jgi:hypothetical protein
MSLELLVAFLAIKSFSLSPCVSSLIVWSIVCHRTVLYRWPVAEIFLRVCCSAALHHGIWMEWDFLSSNGCRGFTTHNDSERRHVFFSFFHTSLSCVWLAVYICVFRWLYWPLLNAAQLCPSTHHSMDTGMTLLVLGRPIITTVSACYLNFLFIFASLFLFSLKNLRLVYLPSRNGVPVTRIPS